MGGISSSTGSNILYGTDGYVTVNGTDVGATEGDIVVQWSLTQYYPDLAQARGPVSGTGIVSEGTFNVTVTLAEFSWTNLSVVMGSLGATSTGTSYKFGGSALNDVTEVSNVAVVGVSRNDGKAFTAIIPTAYVEIGNLNLSEGKESTIEVTFHGLYTTALPTTLPGSIQFQK